MISVVLATHNEAKNITRCLEAVMSFADEIIVVDGESTDETVALAHNYGAKVISTTNKKNFHINKQMAMDAAKGELVLPLDADEVVDDELQKYIVSLHDRIKQGTYTNDHTQPVAWLVKRKNLFLGHFFRKTGQYPDPVIRLYINGYAKLPQKDVHEQMSVSGQVGWAEGHLIHFANPSFADYLRKWNTYTSFKAQQLLESQVRITPATTFSYLLWKPLYTTCLLFFRHKGFVDGVAGLVFSIMSGLHHSMAYLKLWELYEQQKGH